jgi:hypothetical protein
LRQQIKDLKLHGHRVRFAQQLAAVGIEAKVFER